VPLLTTHDNSERLGATHDHVDESNDNNSHDSGVSGTARACSVKLRDGDTHYAIVHWNHVGSTNHHSLDGHSKRLGAFLAAAVSGCTSAEAGMVP
jgi:hypothetical protein